MAEQTYDINKLPKWAQRRITALEREVEAQQRLLAERAGEVENPSLFVSVFGNYNEDQPIAADGRHLYFKDGDGEVLASVKFDAAERYIDINSWQGLLVKPRAGNSLHLLLPPR